jgi:hypothetical protein
MVMVLQARIVTRSGVARTTSLAVAEDFGRSHHAVVCDILRLDCTPAFFDKHFRSVQMVVSGPLGRDTLTHYELTKEGFLLLTGAYRGEDTRFVREAYLDAFKQARIEETLSPALQPGAMILKQLAFYRNMLQPQDKLALAQPIDETNPHDSGSWCFDFGEKPIRSLKKDGEVWFVAKDVAIALDYPQTTISNMTKTIGHVPDEWKGRYRIPTPGGNQEMAVVSEQGLYFFLGRSDKPKALPFQKWLAGEVLPQLRRTGTYSLPPSPQASLPHIDYRVVGRSGFVLSSDLYLRLYLANNRERASATLIWLLMHENALEQPVNFTLRELEEISGGELSRNGIFKCVRRLAARGVLIWEAPGAGNSKSHFQLAENVLVRMLTEIEPSVVALLGKVRVPVLRPRQESDDQGPLLH